MPGAPDQVAVELIRGRTDRISAVIAAGVWPAGAQQIEQRRVGAGAILRKAGALEQRETTLSGIGFCLSDQARFADPGLASDQHCLLVAAARAINMLVEGLKLRSTADQYRADDRLRERCRHCVSRSLITDNVVRL